MRFNCIHHIAIISSDYQAAYHFYSNILGLSVICDTIRQDKNDRKIDMKLNETTQIELFIKEDAPSRATNPEALGLRHLAFRVDRIEQYVAYLLGQGVKVDPIRLDSCTGEKVAFFYDPEGLPIELHE